MPAPTHRVPRRGILLAWATVVLCVVLLTAQWPVVTYDGASGRIDASGALLNRQAMASNIGQQPLPARTQPLPAPEAGSVSATAIPNDDSPGARPTAISTSTNAVFFSIGQSLAARRSVDIAIEKQPPPKVGLLWGSVQHSWEQAERESDNVRRLLQADGMPRWRPDLRKLPPQRPANASMEVLLQHVPVGGTAWLAFGNSGVTEMLMNWAHHVISLGYAWQMVVAAFDEPLLLALHERRIPAYNYTGALPATHFRHAPHLFHRMGYLKAECIRLVLETGRHVLVSDSDVAWTADPLPLLTELMVEGASVGASTDCLNPVRPISSKHRPHT